MKAAELEAQGWQRIATNAFSGVIGSSWIKHEGDEIRVALVPESTAINENIGTLHGGALLTFADIALGYAVAAKLGHANFATVQLQYQFAGAGRVGELIVCTSELVRKTSQLAFVRGLMTAGERTLGAADAIFAILDPAKVEKLRSG